MDQLRIVQGDSVDILLELEGDTVHQIATIDFNCEPLGLNCALKNTINPVQWLLSIPAEDTKDLRIGQFPYNLVVTFNSGRKKTILYQAGLEVFLKDNKWTKAR